MLWIINTITVVRVSKEHETAGLDNSQHAEDSYT